MGAKVYLLVIGALAASGCSGGLKRFAPPGLVKYEDLAKGQPPNPAIVERIEAQKTESGGGFPDLAAQPTTLPEGIARPEREAMIDELLENREILNAAIDSDRREAAGERVEPLELARSALDEAVADDMTAARRERATGKAQKNKKKKKKKKE